MRALTLVIALTVGFLMESCFSSSGDMRYYGEDGGSQRYYLGVSEYYEVSESDVVAVEKRSIPDEDIPVVFFIARRANVAPAQVIDMRSQGASWMDISLHFGVDPDAYYIPLEDVSGPYGRAYGYYRERPRNEWKSIRLSDDDIVNFVNLRFVSEHYNYDAHDVMKMRADGKNFVTIHNQIRTEKTGRDENDHGKGREKSEARRGDH